MKVVTKPDELSSLHRGIFVPTMGALHAGHAALVRQAAKLRDSDPARPLVIVSIFVNPTQFNDPADLARYPRTLEADLRLCEAAGADAVFTPGPEVVYPSGVTIPTPPLPPVATEPKLEDARRPGHFAGVCQVVARLFDLVRPSAALFGEKDWQQLQVITAMTVQLQPPIHIVPVPTIREHDGLAMSSRNVFLAPDQRRRAAAISLALCNACAETTPAAAEAIMARTLADAALDIEYAVVRESASLLPPTPAARGNGPFRCLIAARSGGTRLIDNAPWTNGPSQ
ncbi:MAG: pantoate--beta-alanine ligase [Phycisphaerales bacterium]